MSVTKADKASQKMFVASEGIQNLNPDRFPTFGASSMALIGML
jgi:hypothetical protein